MHGGKRNKFTHWVSFNPRNPTSDLFQSLHLLCDNSHAHASWAPYTDDTGKRFFPTASEAAYPELLCQRVACILKEEALRTGFIFPIDYRSSLSNAAKGKFSRLSRVANA